MLLVSWEFVRLYMPGKSREEGARDFCTNRTSWGPCKTEALTVAFEGNVGRGWDVSGAGRASAIADGAIIAFTR